MISPYYTWRSVFYQRYRKDPLEVMDDLSKPRIPYQPHGCATGTTHYCNTKNCECRIPYPTEDGTTWDYSVRWNLTVKVHNVRTSKTQP